jgi:hypothetical protein
LMELSNRVTEMLNTINRAELKLRKKRRRETVGVAAVNNGKEYIRED